MRTWGEDYDIENLEWTQELLENSCSDELCNLVLKQMLELPPLHHGRDQEIKREIVERLMKSGEESRSKRKIILIFSRRNNIFITIMLQIRFLHIFTHTQIKDKRSCDCSSQRKNS